MLCSHELIVLSHWTHGMRSSSDLTVRSWWAGMNSMFYHTWLTLWDHYLISLWDHAVLTWAHSFFTLNSRHDIIIWSHCEIMVSSHELNVLSHWTHSMRSLSDPTVSLCCIHMNSQFYHTRQMVWGHDLFSLWDHSQLTWTYTFITLGSQCEIIIWFHCQIMVSSHELTVFITYDSQYDIIIWSHCEIMVSSHELTVLSH